MWLSHEGKHFNLLNVNHPARVSGGSRRPPMIGVTDKSASDRPSSGLLAMTWQLWSRLWAIASCSGITFVPPALTGLVEFDREVAQKSLSPQQVLYLP